LLLTAAEAAKLLAISERTLWSLSAAGEVPRVKIRKAVRYRIADLQAYINRLAEKGGTR
jgi:excisionase family DNA binding protein